MGSRTKIFQGPEESVSWEVDAGNMVVIISHGKHRIPLSINQARKLHDAIGKAILFNAESFDPIEVPTVGTHVGVHNT